MFEQNLTNDDQKPICDAYVNGIPAGEQNEGDDNGYWSGYN